MKKRPPAPARALLTLLPQQTTKLLQLVPDFYFTRKNPFFFQPSSYCQGGLNFLPGSCLSPYPQLFCLGLFLYLVPLCWKIQNSLRIPRKLQTTHTPTCAHPTLHTCTRYCAKPQLPQQVRGGVVWVYSTSGKSEFQFIPQKRRASSF